MLLVRVAPRDARLGLGRWDRFTGRQRVTRKRNRRNQAVANRRAKLQGPPRNRANEAHDAADRQVDGSGSRRDRGTVPCGWCGADITVAARGRLPKWCSGTCRHRAWEQRRAAASGLAALDVVDRPIEVVRTVTRIKRVVMEAPRQAQPRTTVDRVQLIAELADDLDRGRIYDREVREMMPAMRALVAAFNRRYD